MSIKSTQRITRDRAIEILMADIPVLPNSALEDLLDTLADTEASHHVSIFDNFIVSDFPEENINATD